jgi:hypothetical protein
MGSYPAPTLPKEQIEEAKEELRKGKQSKKDSFLKKLFG